MEGIESGKAGVERETEAEEAGDETGTFSLTDRSVIRFPIQLSHSI